MSSACVVDVTAPLSATIPDDLSAAISGLSLLRRHFGRETISAAIGEVSEVLVARYPGADRTPRGSLGHDIMLSSGRSVEVKARISDRYGDTTQFNFGRHTEATVSVFCLAWKDNSSGVVRLDQALEIATLDLLAKWRCTQARYCARTTLGKLRAAISP